MAVIRISRMRKDGRKKSHLYLLLHRLPLHPHPLYFLPFYTKFSFPCTFYSLPLPFPQIQLEGPGGLQNGNLSINKELNEGTTKLRL